MNSISYRLFSGWAGICYRNAAWVVLAAFLAVTLCIVYIARNLGVHTDTTDMLSDELPFRVNDIRYMAEFPQHHNAMLLVIDAPAPEQAYSVSKQLTAKLQQDTAHIEDAYYLAGDPFLERNGLLFKSIEELEQVTDQLAAAQPLVSRLANDPSLYTFAAILSEAIEELHSGRKLELATIFDGVSASLEARLVGTSKALSWHELFSGSEQESIYRELILAKPKLDYSQLFSAQQSIEGVRDVAKQVGLYDGTPIKFRITGEAALANDELNSAMLGAQDAGLFALTMVAVVLFLALRHVGAMLIVLLSLIIGIILTAAFATVAVGHLNLISIAFAVLYIGLGVDYAIHFLLRLQESRESEQSIFNALKNTSGNIGRALAVCAVTTAIGFYAFIPTAYRGVAELGVISGTGMLISLIVTISIVSALQRYLPIAPRIRPTSTGAISKTIRMLPVRLRKLVFLMTLFGLGLALVALPRIKFDYNLLNLNDPQAESVQTFQELLADEKDSAWHAVILADHEREAKQVVSRLETLSEVDTVVSIFDLVPAKQMEKLDLIDEMALTLGPIVFMDQSAVVGEYTLVEQRTALEKLNQLLIWFIAEQPDHSVVESMINLQNFLSRFVAHFDTVYSENSEQAGQLLEGLRADLLGLLPEALSRLQIALEAAPFLQQELPASIKDHWLSKNGVYRIAVYPSENISENDALRRFVRAVQHVAPQATGIPIISLEAGEAVVEAFIHAFSLALIGVIVALLIMLRNIVDTILVMMPLLLAAIFTGAMTVLLDVPLNFANIIALPLLLGIGIDCSIHMVHRNRYAAKSGEELLQTSTTRAIYYSALTTLAGFGSLVFSSHQGTASMGLLLAVGVVFTLLCVLVILPAILHQSNRLVIK